MKKRLPIWIPGWIEEIQWIITRERKFLQSPKHADYTHAKKGWKGFEIKNVGEYHDLYAQSDKSLLDDYNFIAILLQLS